MAHNKSILQLKAATEKYYRTSGRHTLPWRVKQTPYRVFVSEVMLQQTQVDRVLPKFNAFIQAFPTFGALGAASLSEVYALWQGLGYNRRAKFLRDAAKIVSEKYGGVLPKQKEVLRRLPGVGPYTAGALLTFAYGNPDVFVETNLRTAVMHHVFPKKKIVTDAEIMSVLESLKPKKGEGARRWYAALMDYGAYLKRTGVRLNHKSNTYTKQSPFFGSVRQVRGALLREIYAGAKTEAALSKKLLFKKEKIRGALSQLSSEGLIVCKKGRWSAAS